MIEKQRHIGDLLRAADREIKNGNLETATAYIKRIFELEVKNVYAKAYHERITSLFEAKGLSRLDAEQKVAGIVPADIKGQSPAAPKEAATPSQTPPAQRKEEAVPSKTVSPPKPAAPAPPTVKQSPAAAPAAASHKSAATQIRRSAAASEAYRTLLMEIWKDGTISPDEQSRVDSMRETFAITIEEHAQFEREVRQTSYLHAVRDEWKKGMTNFEPLQKKFAISPEEKNALESKVLQLIQSLQSNGSVLFLDDDESFLNVVKSLLEEGGYYCFTAKTGEEGLHVLESMTPDVVICDINFTKPNMTGFAFYEKFRSIDKFLLTPFIFLSGLDQDVLVRTGKKLGADDYLFKPIDAEMLLATVEGKLRRARELKRYAAHL